MKFENLVNQLSALNPGELGQLIGDLEGSLGVKVRQTGSQAGPVPGPAPVAAEKTEFNVQLVSFGEKKVQVIKIVRELAKLGLVEAKALVERAPTLILEGVPKTEAEVAQAKLKAEGATVEIK